MADRLNKLDVGKDKEPDDWTQRCVANGVRVDYFVKAVAWCKEPPVQVALVELFKRAEDVDALLAALPAVEDRNLIRRRLEAALAALPAKEGGPYVHGFYILRALLQRTPREARVAFERYLRDAGVERFQDGGGTNHVTGRRTGRGRRSADCGPAAQVLRGMGNAVRLLHDSTRLHSTSDAPNSSCGRRTSRFCYIPHAPFDVTQLDSSLIGAGSTQGALKFHPPETRGTRDALQRWPTLAPVHRA